MKISVIILTKNEEMHIERCIKSLGDNVDEIIVVDSFSEDSTRILAEQFEQVRFFERSWKNYSDQYAFAQSKCSYEVVLRIDADEVLVNSHALRPLVESLSEERLAGIEVNRNIIFLGKRLRYGGVNPVKQLRLYLKSKGEIESRYMDEHIIVDGEIRFADVLHIDDVNLNNLEWWIRKHVGYAQRERLDIIDILNSEIPNKHLSKSARLKRYLKKNVYIHLSFLGPFLFFLYRYVLLLGFLDGKIGLIYHINQGLWYRFFVQSLVYENYSND